MDTADTTAHTRVITAHPVHLFTVALFGPREGMGTGAR